MVNDEHDKSSSFTQDWGIEVVYRGTFRAQGVEGGRGEVR